jgi:hypothetical protein
MSRYFELLQQVVKTRGPLPLVTWVSDLGRIELSTVTFANAVSKASNFLIDGLELDEDGSIAVELDNHFINHLNFEFIHFNQRSIWLLNQSFLKTTIQI